MGTSCLHGRYYNIIPGGFEVKYPFPNSSYLSNQVFPSAINLYLCINVRSMTTYEYKCKIYSFTLACMYSVVFMDVVGGEYIVMNKKDRVFVLIKLVF